jgi:hypothetical protein
MESRSRPDPRRRVEQRIEVLAHLAAGVLTEAQAAAILHRSERQVRRLAAAHGRDGPAGLRHGNATRIPANRTERGLHERLVVLA